MNFSLINFKKANENLKWILLVGLSLGIANYSLDVWPTLGQSIMQSTAISLVIGYSLILIATNLTQIFPADFSPLKKNLFLFLVFCVTGLVGSEIESIVRHLFFQQTEYQFLGHQSIYLFNIILTNVLGFGTVRQFSQPKPAPIEEVTNPEILTTIPIKQGENTHLYPLTSISYFEAYDNYAFLFDINGKKHLCNYSLLTLEKKLPPNFVRVHRKHLINKDQISQIKPHFKGRFVIVLKGVNETTITSSNSYTETIKSIIKL